MLTSFWECVVLVNDMTDRIAPSGWLHTSFLAAAEDFFASQCTPLISQILGCGIGHSSNMCHHDVTERHVTHSEMAFGFRYYCKPGRRL
jgi:hypothetical protein